MDVLDCYWHLHNISCCDSDSHLLILSSYSWHLHNISVTSSSN